MDYIVTPVGGNDYFCVLWVSRLIHSFDKPTERLINCLASSSFPQFLFSRSAFMNEVLKQGERETSVNKQFV